MADSTSFRSVIELWETREAMASEIGARAPAVSKWWQRDTIPPEWWLPIMSTDKAKAAGVTSDVFARLASRKTVEARA